MNRSILIVDDDERVRTSLSEALEEAGLEVTTAADGPGALAALSRCRPSIVLADIRMPGMGGLELLGLLAERAPGLPVILMTAYDDLTTVVEGMRRGAVDFLVKPIDLEELQGLIGRIRDDRRRRDGAASGAGVGAGSDPLERIVGHHPSVIRIFKVIGQVADSRTNVLIRGESGTGKELIARAIHDSSPRAAEPFVPVNCTALPSSLLESELFGHRKGSFTGAASDRKGRFALAGKGTIFLDEIGDTSPGFQAKLLRVLQEQEFYPVGAERPERTAARVIAATHRDLEALVETGEFREDLYYRLRVVEITVPPLRERRTDIPDLAEHLVARVSRGLDRPTPLVDPAAMDVLLAHAWPGNVRELENCLTRATVLASSGVIHPEHLSLGPSPHAPPPRVATLEEVERDHLVEVLTVMGGRKTRTAEALGISRPRLDRLIEKYDLRHLAHTRGSSEDPD